MAAEAASAWVVSRFIANATDICKLPGTGELAESPPLQSTLQLLALTLLTDGAPGRLEAACEARSFVTVYIGVPLRTTYLLRLPHDATSHVPFERPNCATIVARGTRFGANSV